jgi:hypothetical protein
MTELSQTNWFIDKTKKPQDDQGIIDIGHNCYKCSELDFLPFICEFCKHTYCSKHRTLEQHDCSGKGKFGDDHSRSALPSTTLPKSSTLFPDRTADRKKVDHQLTSSTPKPTNIVESQFQFRVGDAGDKVRNAFTKFNKFLSVQKTTTKSKSIMGFTKRSASAKPNKGVELALLRKQAKGDGKIPVNDRIYIWALYINANDDDDLRKINVDKERCGVFVSKAWPVGRALDSIADQLAVRNYNNNTNDSQQRLNIFKVVNDNPVVVSSSERCIKAFGNGDTIYLVKGSLE